MTATLTQVTEAIAAGVADDNFDFVVDAIRRRQRTLSSQQAAQFAPGDTVMFNDKGLRYVAGVKAVVKRVNDKSVTVDIEDNPQARRFSGSTGVRADASQLVKVDGPDAASVMPAAAVQAPVSPPAFASGDRVRFVAGRPRYLIGVQGTVSKINDKTVGVDIDDNPRARGFSGAKGVRVPVSSLAAVDA